LAKPTKLPLTADDNAFPRSLRARWVFPVSEPPLRDAAVTVFQGRIIAVGKAPHDVPVEDLGQAAIVPGFVNAHTHLEFSDLPGPIGRPGMGFVEWLGSVIAQRVNETAGCTSPIEQGLRESVGHGVTTIGEIAQAGGDNHAYLASPCDGTVFLELIAPRIERVDAALAAAERHILGSGLRDGLIPSHARMPGLRSGDDAATWQPGLSPHAPYTVHPELLAGVVELSIKHEIPLAMHLAESRDEIDFLRDGRGPLRELLESRDAWDPTARPHRSRPLDELRMFARAHRAMVVHGNYLDDEEIGFLGQRPQMAVVYCPRTHAWFGHDRYPLEKLLSAGAVVALGTDSRASSPDLSVLAEMRHVARAFPAMSRATILELGTLGGARALGLDAQIGTLEPGKRANLAVIALPEGAAADPYELLLDTAGRVAGTWIHGDRINPDYSAEGG